ncbi:hypothetical protein NKI95_12100 [Mesorhizobium sp. M0306]|uniref:hypothetical protein n=1 Tax=Mesorhizobium sp. M0306 TaxID=2956932 RepID=UPI00333B7E2F
MSGACTWLKKNTDQITSAAAIAGVLVAGVGFWVTWYQLSETTAALKASNTYTIQNDGRELLDVVQGRGYVRDLLAGTLKPEDQTNAKFDIWKMLNFYLSVYRQSQADGITDEFRRAYVRDFCGFVALPGINAAWKEMIAEKSLNEQQINMREDWCEGK